MFGNRSLNTRIAVGKMLGALFGLAGFIYLTVYPVGDDSLLRWGILLWYTTLGAIIGVFGVYTWNPVLKLPMLWWFLAPLLGAWMNFSLSRTRFPWTQNWLNRSVQGGPEHDR